MKPAWTNLAEAMEALTKDAGEKGGIVVPAILWWLGAPLTLLVILWLLGVF